MAAYSTSKFAVLGLTQGSATDLAPYQITVNAVCPGTVNTDRLNYWEQEQARAKGVPAEEFRSQIVANSAKATPLGRSSTVEDIVRAVRFILATPSLTGQVLTLDGGESLAGRPRDVAFQVK